ncbi:carboxymuconolactone decarboxylase family protein [Mycoplasma phocoenae]|uniref:Carboxymuconolactone decarboxylase family protein n=1 Tax=Mycoplasma phocoenae TaxID=754517 RepID=A0A858U7Q9_9MOLU|nr:carboxymuconolactone decarboxylase family protein [Mycoplasma phocoenae]QJG67253.1 carboxymuconolactone decarboxylase family protein [Mycoplasma phocoenae]
MEIKEKINTISKNYKRFKDMETYNEYLDAFQNLNKVVYKEGAVSTKHKELTAVAIATSQRCEPCLISHIKKAIIAGATKEEIIESALVACAFSGGPALNTVIQTVQVIIEEYIK